MVGFDGLIVWMERLLACLLLDCVDRRFEFLRGVNPSGVHMTPGQFVSGSGL